MRATGEPVYDGDEIIEMRGAIRDITAQKQRQEELQRYEQLVEYSPGCSSYWTRR